MNIEAMFPTLSKRQVGILHSLATGHTNKQIGMQEGISERTVEYHVGNLLEIYGLTGELLENYNPRTRLCYVFYRTVNEVFNEVLRGN